MRLLSLRAVAVAAGALSLLPASAAASSVSYVTLPPPSPPMATYTGAPGEVNKVTVSRDGSGKTVFTDAGGFTITNIAPANCSVAGNVATCDPGSAVVNGDDMDDDLKTAVLPPAGGGVLTPAIALFGGAGGDRLSTELAPSGGVAAGLILDGGLGADTVIGGVAAATLFGGDDADTITGGPAAETIDGGLGNDPLVDGGGGSDTVNGGEGNDLVRGGSGDDGVAPVGLIPLPPCVFGVNGGPGDDTVEGGPGNDGVCGGQGIVGSATDVVRGGDGDDRLEDGDISGTPNADGLDGGPGRDTVAYQRLTGVTVTLGDDVAEGGERQRRAAGRERRFAADRERDHRRGHRRRDGIRGRERDHDRGWDRRGGGR